MGKEILTLGDIEIEKNKLYRYKVLPLKGTKILKKY